MIDSSTDTQCPAIALVGAHGQQRIIEARRLWSEAEVALALQEAADVYAVPIAIERPVAAQPVQTSGQIPPGRRIKKPKADTP
jgi:hypothetical protein